MAAIVHVSDWPPPGTVVTEVPRRPGQPRSIAANGITLQLNQGLGDTKALVGQLAGSGFTLTYPGTTGDLIQIDFMPSSVDNYNTQVAELQNQTSTAPQATDTSTSFQTTNPPTTTNQATNPPSPGGCNCSVADLPNHCDPNISTTSNATCSLAQNAFYEYYKATNGDPSQPATTNVWDPKTQRYYGATCSSGDGVVDCGIGKNGRTETYASTSPRLPSILPPRLQPTRTLLT